MLIFLGLCGVSVIFFVYICVGVLSMVWVYWVVFDSPLLFNFNYFEL